MGDAIDDHVAILNREHGTPIALAYPVGPRLADQRSNAEMLRAWHQGYCFQTLQQPPSVCLRQCGKLL